MKLTSCCVRFILLSDCRCGGTALRKLLGMIDEEPLLQPWLERFDPDYISYNKEHNLDPCPITLRGPSHIQRYQVEDLGIWCDLVALPIKVIDLTRLDTIAQYKSWVAARTSNVWHNHPRRRPAKINWKEYEKVSLEWERLRVKGLRAFQNHPLLEITYEEFEESNDACVNRCLEFLSSPD